MTSCHFRRRVAIRGRRQSSALWARDGNGWQAMLRLGKGSNHTKPEVRPDALVAFADYVSQRELDVAFYDRVAHADKYYEACAEERIVDVSQSITRYPRSNGLCLTMAAGTFEPASGSLSAWARHIGPPGLCSVDGHGQLGADAVLDFTDRRVDSTKQNNTSNQLCGGGSRVCTTFSL